MRNILFINRTKFRKVIIGMGVSVCIFSPTYSFATSPDFGSADGIHQQLNTVSGTVVDGMGEPIIGATVLEKGTTNGTITDFDGKFSFSINKFSR